MTSAVFQLGIAALLLAATPAATYAQTRLTVDGTEFVLTTPDGRTLRSADLIGATLKIRAQGRPIEVTVQSVEAARYAVGGRVVLHRFAAKDESGKSVGLCKGDAEGRNQGFPVPDDRGGFDLTCTSGAVGKCIRWGYRHWEEQPGGPPLRALHRACVHMARADYGGDGNPSTRDGTLIDIHDHFGIQRFDREVRMAFEAAWGVDGAICVARPRVSARKPLYGSSGRSLAVSRAGRCSRRSVAQPWSCVAGRTSSRRSIATRKWLRALTALHSK